MTLRAPVARLALNAPRLARLHGDSHAVVARLQALNEPELAHQPIAHADRRRDLHGYGYPIAAASPTVDAPILPFGEVLRYSCREVGR